MWILGGTAKLEKGDDGNEDKKAERSVSSWEAHLGQKLGIG